MGIAETFFFFPEFGCVGVGRQGDRWHYRKHVWQIKIVLSVMVWKESQEVNCKSEVLLFSFFFG